MMTLQRLALRLLAVAALAAGLIVPLAATATSAQAMTCDSSWPQWTSGKAYTYGLSSKFLMCDPVESDIQFRFTTSGDLQYVKGSTIIWHTNTAGAGKELRLQTNGAFTVYGCSGTNCTQAYHLLWSSNTQVSGSGWNFLLSLTFAPGTHTLYVTEDNVASNGTNYLHRVGAGTTAPY